MLFFRDSQLYYPFFAGKEIELGIILLLKIKKLRRGKAVICSEVVS